MGTGPRGNPQAGRASWRYGDLALEGENEGQEARIINTLVFDVGNWVDEGAEWECSRAGREEAQ